VRLGRARRPKGGEARGGLRGRAGLPSQLAQGGRGQGGTGWATATPAHDVKGKGRGGSRPGEKAARPRGGRLVGLRKEAGPREKGGSFLFSISYSAITFY
jgi:hypothetical protein